MSSHSAKASYAWKRQQIDMKYAFLHNEVDRGIYKYQSMEFECKEIGGHVFKLETLFND